MNVSASLYELSFKDGSTMHAISHSYQKHPPAPISWRPPYSLTYASPPPPPLPELENLSYELRKLWVSQISYGECLICRGYISTVEAMTDT